MVASALGPSLLMGGGREGVWACTRFVVPACALGPDAPGGGGHPSGVTAATTPAEAPHSARGSMGQPGTSPFVGRGRRADVDLRDTHLLGPDAPTAATARPVMPAAGAVTRPPSHRPRLSSCPSRKARALPAQARPALQGGLVIAPVAETQKDAARRGVGRTPCRVHSDLFTAPDPFGSETAKASSLYVGSAPSPKFVRRSSIFRR